MYSIFEMNTPYHAKSIANYFLSKGKMSPMKLQKLVYFAHGWCLALTDRPLIDEKVQAWDYGPVVPSLYHEFKTFGTNNIDRAVYGFSPPREADAIALLDRIWEVYGKFTAVQLSNATHASNSPWEKVVTECKNKSGGLLLKNQIIDNEQIKQSFKANTT